MGCQEIGLTSIPSHTPSRLSQISSRIGFPAFIEKSQLWLAECWCDAAAERPVQHSVSKECRLRRLHTLDRSLPSTDRMLMKCSRVLSRLQEILEVMICCRQSSHPQGCQRSLGILQQ